ncbi:iron hydrogenase 1 [Oxobacter pfennigii]|uniref:Iron hydrogenase 1 n=1 Tax=Oxobacter pfennigii TaxID=36849 RepID=A0A0P8X5J6_9CLOT|nr:[Fe-Fe] hydrogenase large subunit C-terminal domain-containing protein [Oxobacter pfennigii]KPU46111.1 iron hydrogenase 1 [Oxobacter pfennigii]
MSIIQYKKADCRNCYKCIRQCPVKAIAYKNDQVEIIDEDCILCGNCLSVCPQNAKSIRRDIELVKASINKKEKVYVSLAPSFAAAFENVNERLMTHALEKLGFIYVEETALAAYHVSRQYEKLMSERKMKNIITTACPSIVYLVERYYPELVDMLAPVISPMVAHGKMLKEMYGPRIKVVFIGPCASKKQEFKDINNAGVISFVLTFQELKEWMADEGIYLNGQFSEDIKKLKETSGRIYPLPGGILKTIDSKFKKNYKSISIDGVDRCIKALDSIKNEGMENYFIEMNSCAGGCIGGPCMSEVKGGLIEARTRLIDYIRKNSAKIGQPNISEPKIDFSRKFSPRSHNNTVPSDEVIQEILNSTGKFTPDKELNCGACGYSTCRDKAIAVYNKKAQLYMCMPYMKERAESISNLVISTAPQAIFALDSELRIQELNNSARELFGLKSEIAEGRSIHEILKCPDIEKVMISGTNINDSKYYYEEHGVTVEQSIIYIPEQKTTILIIKDITKEEQRRKQMHQLSTENVELAQKVIDKQMRVAQEIASLLGETTAETKVALTKLKKSIVAEVGDAE